MGDEDYLFQRDCGILLHPTSLPNDYGVGDFGPAAIRWIDFLSESGQNLWQILPLNPAGYGDSPYQGLSAFAANPVFLSPESVYAEGLISKDLLRSLEIPSGSEVDYARVYAHKLTLSEVATDKFFKLEADHPLRKAFASFLESEADWIHDFACFYALKKSFGGVAWTDWPGGFRDRAPEALERAESALAGDIMRAKMEQFLLRRQWDTVRAAARKRDIRIIGDLPIFVAHDSVDVWCQRDLFRLNEDGRPSVVAGVPPDYFSSTGQLWGNPLYRWDKHRDDGFTWWRNRLKQTLAWVDVVRVDHFRGFDACWEIPGNAKTAMDGRWIPAPGREVFEKFAEDWGWPLPVIAEDLGVITPEVVELRDAFKLPGIRIEQFAFGTDPMRHTFAPESYQQNCVAYTGTHDNDTVVGWFNSTAGEGSTRSAEQIEAERSDALSYLGSDGSDIHFDFIRSLFASDCGAAVVPIQDVMGLGSQARMNTPGQPSGSWRWRLESFELLKPAMLQLTVLTSKTERGSHAPETTRLYP